MAYYTERHGLRKPVDLTEKINPDMYRLLIETCFKYNDNIAWKYPCECPDGYGCSGLDRERFFAELRYEIPDLFINGKIETNPYSESQYDQFALLDLIELYAANCRVISNRYWHSYFRHDHLEFKEEIDKSFRDEINQMFKKMGLLYTLSEDGMVQRVDRFGLLSQSVDDSVNQIKETGLKELIQDAILLYKTPAPHARQDSVEKIWDAFERMKSYYITLDKKGSAGRIVKDMAEGNEAFEELLNTEFQALTKIGNQYRIRHHETDKKEIISQLHYDYLFNRCLALISMALQYLK